MAFLLLSDEKKHAARGRLCGRAAKSPARHPARASGVVSMNTFFWKILVTRVKRKVVSSIKSRVEKRYQLSRRHK
jgi:hypothetical protein